MEPESNPVIRLVRGLIPVTSVCHGQKLFVREDVAGRMRRVATPLFVVPSWDCGRYTSSSPAWSADSII